MNKLLIILLSLLLFSCYEKNTSISKENRKIENKISTKIEKIDTLNNDNSTNSKEITEPSATKILPKKCYFGDIEINILQNNNKINVKSNDEFVEETTLDFKGDLDAFIETDVDGNGFSEFYLVSNTGDLIAFSSYMNKSFGKINVLKKPFTFYNNCKKVKFWEAKNKKLSITFEDDMGEMVTVRYKLKMGETSYQLVAE